MPAESLAFEWVRMRWNVEHSREAECGAYGSIFGAMQEVVVA